MQATFYGHRAVAKRLLEAGADPLLLATTNGCSALDLATLVEETDTELLRLLAGSAIAADPPSLSVISGNKVKAPQKEKANAADKKKQAFVQSR